MNSCSLFELETDRCTLLGCRNANSELRSSTEVSTTSETRLQAEDDSMLLDTEGRRLLLQGQLLKAKRFFANEVRTQTDPMLISNAHFELALMYKDRKKLLGAFPLVTAAAYRYHIRKAVNSEPLLPDADFEYAAFCHAHGWLEKAIDHAEKARAKQTALSYVAHHMDLGPGSDRSAQEALLGITLAATAYCCDAGRFRQATECLETIKSLFNALADDQRNKLHHVWPLVYNQQIGLLLATHQYSKAAHVARQSQSDLFLAMHDPDDAKRIGHLEPLLQSLLTATAPSDSDPNIDELIGDLWGKISRSQSMEELECLKEGMIDAVSTSRANRHIHELAQAEIRLLNEQIDILDSLGRPSPPAAGLPSLDPRLIDVLNEAERSELLGREKRRDDLIRISNERVAQFEKLSRTLADLLKRLCRDDLEAIQELDEDTYHAPYLWSIGWCGLWLARHIVGVLSGVIAFGMLLDRLTHKLVEKGLGWAIAIGVAGYVLDGLTTGLMDSWLIGLHRRLLRNLLGRLSSVLWVRLNTMLKIFAGTKQTVEQQLSNSLGGQHGSD